MDQIIEGDCVEVLKTFPQNSIDSCVTDPPYGLAFMGKKWDILNNHDSPKENGTYPKNRNAQGMRYSESNGKLMQEWHYKWAKEVFRVLKPGGYLLSFGGTRTYHRMACAIEDAGFEIRDMIAWVYGSGFPKSLNIGKAIDKGKGIDREVIGKREHPTLKDKSRVDRQKSTQYHANNPIKDEWDITAPATSEAKQWEGWGTALKPAFEPIVVARKPISEKTIAENVLKWGTGGINIDGSRIEYTKDNRPIPQLAQGKTEIKTDNSMYGGSSYFESKTKSTIGGSLQGRFPANFIHDGSEEVTELFPNSKSTGGKSGHTGAYSGGYKEEYYEGELPGFGDNGSASRFFYCAKASKSERNMGCEELEEKQRDESRKEGNPGGDNPRNRGVKLVKNNHPTVKPIALMRYLVKLVTPSSGIVLDPFAGSGSTLIAAKDLGFNFIGIDLESEYIEIANKRIASLPDKLL